MMTGLVAGVLATGCDGAGDSEPAFVVAQEMNLIRHSIEAIDFQLLWGRGLVRGKNGIGNLPRLNRSAARIQMAAKAIPSVFFL